MERIGFTMRLLPGQEAEYRRRHAAVWPEMLDALRDTGWTNYSLFVDRRDGTLIGYFETDDLEAARAGMAAREVNARWQAEMAGFFQDIDGRPPDQGFLRLDEIFRLQPSSTTAPA